MPDRAKTLASLTGAILALVGVALLFQGNFYLLPLIDIIGALPFFLTPFFPNL